MKKINARDLINEINALRAAAGLKSDAYHGTSIMSLRTIALRARNGEFN